MFKVSESVIIERSPTEVFEAAADPHTQLKWDPGTLKSVEKLTPGPIGQGARYRGVFSGFGIVEYEFPEYEPGRRFAHRAMMPMGEVYHTFDFEAVPEGTRLIQSIAVQPKGLARLMTPLMKVMLRNRVRVINSELRQYLQTQKAASALS
jgi:uncharacterized protein YndB with AHSA1/START domain